MVTFRNKEREENVFGAMVDSFLENMSNVFSPIIKRDSVPSLCRQDGGQLGYFFMGWCPFVSAKQQHVCFQEQSVMDGSSL